MRSLKKDIPSPGRLIFNQEIRSLLLSRALWTMLIIISLLVGYSFIQAVDLFSRASGTALSFPELASGMDPLTGIFVPTFGAYYLTQTLLLPFVAIRLIGLDKQSGSLKLLLQFPLSPFKLCALKTVAITLVVGLGSAIPALSTLCIWRFLGGHISFLEIAVLASGHFLYSLTVIGIAMFAAAISKSLPTAAMFCLAVTLGSWVLDFATAGQETLPDILGSISLLGMLRRFESGLLSSVHVISFCSLAFLFFILTVIFLHPGRRTAMKVSLSLTSIFISTLIVSSAHYQSYYLDVTENKRHSFNPADARALRQIDKPLHITLHLDHEDSRLKDLEKNFLAKLKRTVPHLVLHYAATNSTGLFNAAETDKYGLIEYEYARNHDQSYSNSENEILPIIYTLAGITSSQETMPLYKGYPLVDTANGSRWWFYIVLPVLYLLAAVFSRKGPKSRKIS